MKKIFAIGTIVIAFAIVGAFSLQNQSTPTGTPTNEDVLRVGYIIYPPLLMQDSNTGELSGISYDIVERVATDLGYETQWVEEVGWGTALEGLNTNRYDILGTEMWPNDARREVALFSDAPMNSAMYPYIVAGDDRFSADDLEAINSSEFTISVLDGEMTSFIAAEDYPNADTYALPQLSSFAEVFLNILQGKADITFIEPSVAEDFLKSHPGTIERLGDTPVRSFGNSFAFDKTDQALFEKWNEGIHSLVDSGEISEILNTYGALSHYIIN
ncbi:amino acid ABC transporter substrate-binding protein [Candidatus Uhrbacteria bacterium]|nr:amino acid ABC transporter substrate-binding protein [Candidatus Uhrbacteria bacterium]MBT7717194.1 amino acid ABC transporter substrate-binding protein [Candidatus Uhrbacteria bacterium]